MANAIPAATPRTQSSKKPPSRVNAFMSGLAVGLLASALLALYITQSSLPFVDRVGTGRPADKAKAGKIEAEMADPNKGLLSKDAGQVESSDEAGIETRVVSPTGLTYLLQVGAFKVSQDAEQMRARMAILGFEARVSETEKEGVAFYRVRLGPYPSIEELNKAKARLSENGVDSVVIRVTATQPQ